MTVIISTSNSEQTFSDYNEIITIGSSELNDVFVKSEQKFELILEFNKNDKTYIVTNKTGSIPLFKGQPFKNMQITNVARFLFPDSSEFINIKVVTEEVKKDTGFVKQSALKDLCQGDKQSVIQLKLETSKSEIETRRVAIIKEISHKINDLRKKLSQNFKGSVFTHVSLFWACFVCAFGVTNYISGLSIKESADFIHLPTDLKLWLLYTVLILGIMLLLKQGMYGYFASKSERNKPQMSKTVQSVLISFSSVIMMGVYVINLIYYLDYTKNIIFPLLISLFFVGIAISLAVSSAYYKCAGSEISEILNKYEYREDFEKVLKDYRTWIGYFVNNLSDSKKEYIEDLKFKLMIKEFFEVITGLITAPFLAFGVSNTLAMCFPDAAGWIRVSGIRISPIFWTLASFMIIFAFFLFAHGFFLSKKINNSDIIKHDGFSDYLTHCADILGLEATTKIKKEMAFAFYCALSIILIEFTMNVSYFSSAIGQDFYGLFISVMAAFVPTALLIAETFLFGGTKFKLYALEEIKAKVDK